MAIMSGIKLYSDVESMVKVMPRIEALYYFVYELAQCFYADEETLSSIRTGILDNQILSTIHINYLNSVGEKVAGVTIHIDWQKHKMLAQTENGENISIDMGKSVVDNIVGWRKYIVAHIDSIMKQYDVKKVDSKYHYRTEIESDKAEYDKALSVMNHVLAVNNTPSRTNVNLQHELDSSLKAVLTNSKMNGTFIERKLDCGTLQEVTVKMSYKKH
jgi:hypothetical protein